MSAGVAITVGLVWFAMGLGFAVGFVVGRSLEDR